MTCRLLLGGDRSAWDRALLMPHYTAAGMPLLSSRQVSPAWAQLLGEVRHSPPSSLPRMIAMGPCAVCSQVMFVAEFLKAK